MANLFQRREQFNCVREGDMNLHAAVSHARKYRNISYLLMLRKWKSDPGATSGIGATSKFDHF